MERICEPELMDDALQAEAYAAADFSGSDRAVLEEVEDLLGPRGMGLGRGLSFVDLGCGPGNISFLLARRWPEASVLGIDGAPAMLAIAERRRRADPAGHPQLRFLQCVLPSRQLKGGFAAVVSNSLLHHLHEPAVFWESVRRLAAPGACLYVRDLRRPASLAALEELVLRHAVGAPAVLRRDYAHSLRASFTVEEVRRQIGEAGLEGLEVQERNDRYLEIRGRLA